MRVSLRFVQERESCRIQVPLGPRNHQLELGTNLKGALTSQAPFRSSSTPSPHYAVPPHPYAPMSSEMSFAMRGCDVVAGASGAATARQDKEWRDGGTSRLGPACVCEY